MTEYYCNPVAHHCPLITKNRLPISDCPHAIKAILNTRSDSEIKHTILSEYVIKDAEPCEWYINNIESHFCFWKYWTDPSNVKEYTFEEIAYLTCLNVGTIHDTDTKARLKVTLGVLNNVQGFGVDNQVDDIEKLRRETLEKLEKLEKEEKRGKQDRKVFYEIRIIYRSLPVAFIPDVRPISIIDCFNTRIGELFQNDFPSIISKKPFSPQIQLEF